VLASGGRTLTGIVTDATGGPIAGARVDAAKLDHQTKAGRAVAVTFSDPAGHYKLSIGGGAILVAASHPEYASQERYVDLGASGATASFALVPGGVIEGVVRDAKTKQPVAGAVVRSGHAAAPLELAAENDRDVKADAAGKFRFAGLRPGGYELVARAGTRSSRTPVDIGLGVAEQQTDIVLLIDAAATLRGKVLDDSGAPAAKVSVRAFGDGETETTTSDAAGAFVFEGLAPGRWTLSGTSERLIADGRAIVPLAKSDVDGVVVRVRRGLEVTGHVEPREACDVEISKDEPDDMRHETTTANADGTFHFAPFGPGKATLSARCPNGDQGTVDVVVSAGGGESVVRVAPGGSLEGHVVDTSGKPVEGVMVTAEIAGDMTRFENGVVSSGFRAITSTGGAFEIGGLGAASYRLTVLEGGVPMKPKKAVKVALTAGQHATGVDLVIERSTGTIRGTVTGPDGAPVPDAWVSVHQNLFDQVAALRASDDDSPNRVSVNGEPIGGSELPPVLSDARGHFELTSLLRGKYQVVVEARSGKLHGGAADITPDAEIAVHLESVSSLAGSVHGPRGPTDLFSVNVEGATMDDSGGGSFTDGAFSFPRVDPGDYTIEVTSTDGTGKATVHVAPNQAASVDIALVENGTVTGRVVDKTGKPISGVGAALIPDQAPGHLQISLHEEPPTTGPDGRFQVQGAPGTRTLVILGNPPMPKRGVAVTAGTTNDVGDVTVDAQPAVKSP
jgi:protocatechuate 3,4-dioxygenase beta subunit